MTERTEAMAAARNQECRGFFIGRVLRDLPESAAVSGPPTRGRYWEFTRR